MKWTHWVTFCRFQVKVSRKICFKLPCTFQVSMLLELSISYLLLIIRISYLDGYTITYWSKIISLLPFFFLYCHYLKLNSHSQRHAKDRLCRCANCMEHTKLSLLNPNKTIWPITGLIRKGLCTLKQNLFF